MSSASMWLGMGDERSEEERAELLAEFLSALRDDEGRGVTVDETPIGVKVGLEMSSARDAWTQTEADGRAVLDEYEDILVTVYEGDLGVVREVSEEEWPHFVELVEETEGLEATEDELRDVRGGEA